jgi:hypothetical protein
LGETLFFSRFAAISFALFLNIPGAGLVESVFTFADQRLDGGVVERLPDVFEAAFFAVDFFALFFVAIRGGPPHLESDASCRHPR